MAIITENFEINGRAFTKTSSNEYKYIIRDGIYYTEAIDPSEFNRIYTEGGSIEISNDDYELVGQILMGVENNNNEEMSQEYIEIGKILMGVSEDDNI